ncbi:MAG: archaea-specific SMC-related protein, partial [Halarchaeum sp.]
AKRDELSAKRDELDALDGDVAESRTTQDELDEAMATLRELRDEREDVEFERETERESRDAYRADLAEHRDALEALDPASDAERAALEADISSLRDRRQSLDATINQLQRIVQFNEEMLDGEHPEVRGALTDADGAVTDRLVEDRTVCWTCGSEVERDAIGGTLERIRSLRQEKEAERRDLADRIDSLRDEKRAHDERASERERHEARVDDLEAELAASEERIAELDERASDLDDRIAAAEDRVNDLEAAAQSDVLSAHREVTQLEFERDRLADELAEVESEREDVEATLAELPDLEAERERVAADITDLRTRVERMEDDAVESFNDHMARLLDRLAYDNLDRIWIERTGRDGGESASAFALHVVRQTDDGRAYEDTVDHLSESEREVVGLVFALAGYLVHEVYEACPFMLLDSLEAIDSDRIAALVDYFDAFPDYLVVALLEEDARALDEGYHRIESI